jgi:ATP-dependent DNA ligase
MLNRRFPGIVEALASLKGDFVLDGELVALDPQGKPSFQLPETQASRWGETITAEKMSECRWVEPKLVCQVAFLEWTDAGHLRPLHVRRDAR